MTKDHTFEYIYIPPGNSKPIAIDVKPSQELIDYHNKSQICFMMSKELFDRLNKKDKSLNNRAFT